MDDEFNRIMEMLKAKMGPAEAEIKANGGKPTPEMQESMDAFNANQKAVEALIERKKARGDKMYDGFMGHCMDGEIFAKMQEVATGFSPDIFYTVSDCKKFIYKLQHGCEQQLSFDESIKLIFLMAFGAHGYKKDIDTALDMTEGFAKYIMTQKPVCEYSRDNDEYMGWLRAVGQLNILLGTIYAYKNETVKSCYFLIKGLKTEMVQMNTPYTDFIRYMFAKLDDIPKTEYEREGIGYSCDIPCGSVDTIKRMLDSRAAMVIIPDLVSDNGDILICHNGTTAPYGHLERRGSTQGEGITECVDIYETWLIDKDFNLKSVRFYWNGYFNMIGSGTVLLPIGFRIKKQSKIANAYRFVKNQAGSDDLPTGSPY